MSWSAFRTFTDPDAYHASISAYAHAHSYGVITTRGNFRADFAKIPLDRVILRHAEETLPRTAHLVLELHSQPIRASKYMSVALN